MSSSGRPIQRFTLRANERLKLRKQIETLFLKGEAFSVFPVKVMYLLHQLPDDADASKVLVGFSVPKKRVKRAVNRNRIRRISREAWRLNKAALYANIPQGMQLHCFLIFIGNQALTLDKAQETIKKITEQFSKKLRQPSAP